MLLKQMIVKGFKSFADKTEVDIPHGITAFVGPNGCGKSNVSDAIRWVMGEQNPRHLRGMKMQDMIFAGAETRKAESLAEVSLVFDNPDQFFNLPQCEVMITRRLYRSGESEYLINKTSVRLKDIQELFMDTGLGHHSYTLIEQGRVEHMLSSKPAERLAIFEEAAGVTKYKARRDEALRKLGRADQDLLRLSDIEEELGKQSRTLRRQAQQASRYKRLLEELQTAEQIIAARESKRLNTENETFTAKQKEVVELLERDKTELVTLETRLAEISLQIDGFTARLREQHEKHHTAQMEIQKRESQLQFLRETETELKQRKANLEAEIAQGQSRRTLLTENLEKKRAQIQALESQENARQGEHAQRLEQLQQLRNDRRDCDEQLEKHRIRLWDLQKGILACRNEVQQLEQQSGFVDAQEEKALRERTALDEQFERIIDAQRTLSGDFKTKSEEVEAGQLKSQELQTVIAQKISQVQELTEQVRQGEKRLDGFRVRLQLLEQLDRRFEGYQDSAKFVLKRKGNNERPYSFVEAPLADLLNVEKGFEPAVEAALAARLECLVVSGVQEASAILDSLASNDAGRVLLLSKELAARNAQATQSDAPQGNWRRLEEVVTTSDEYRPIVSSLLHGVGFVETLAEATALMQNSDESSNALTSVVTRRGDVIVREGWLSGGRPVAHGVLARKREQTELIDKIKTGEISLRELTETLNTAKKDREILTAEREKLRESLEHLRVELKSLEQEMKAAEREQQRLQAGLNTLSRERDERLGLRTAQKQRFAELQSKDERLKTEESQVRTEFNRLESQLAAYKISLDKKETEYRETELSRLSARKDLERFKSEEGDLQKQLDSLGRRMVQCEQEIAAIEERASRAGLDHENLKSEIAGLLQEAEAVKKLISETESSLQDKINAREESASQQRALNEHYNSELRVANELEKSLLRVDLELKNLRERLKQEFEKELEEIIASAPEDERTTEALFEAVGDIRRKIGQLGEVNALAIEEFEQVEERLNFMLNQKSDLEKARTSLLRTIETLQKTASERFHEAFDNIRENFRNVFRKMFRGGKADLIFIDLENNPDGGVEIIVQPPGKQLQNISLLSGGEKALSAIALLFAMYLTKPSPFCLFDEVDAPLDDQNVGNFCRMIREFSERSQFLIITHNKRTMEMAATIYGVTMEVKGVSKIVSLQLEHTKERVDDDQSVSAAD